MIRIGGAANGSHPPPDPIEPAIAVASFGRFSGVTRFPRYSERNTAAAGSPVTAERSDHKNTPPNLPVNFSTTVITVTI